MSAAPGDQYAPREIDKYEAIYGRDFVSPGGAACARECIARLALRPGDRVLDVGSGLGGSALLMAREFGARVDGMDLSAEMVARARERCRQQHLEDRVRFTRGDCLDLAASRVYHAVYSRDVFLHIEDKARLFRLLREVLVPGGRLLFTDYCCGEEAPSDDFAAYVAERGYHLLPLARYVECLREAGFVAVEGEDWTARFIDISRRELDALPAAGLGADEQEDLRRGWQGKIVRAERGEQRWGLLTARTEEAGA
ncbi:MAG: methyltransferase domain-containing protein [Gammaproteobacteria bacterium]|nr:methyltransferase domain-containing protein [Gammaproteobacteria bacterium]NIM74511.1 methyltransferase domain-containing protein [Gammaproteobacteria bacterium]NIO26344.1 methyltransferase domain-containing protein [Gammaproteobacteria bacterium]NIO66896.1 methyltransferase domain-containing protein [Gammaproteobacteria bacterium]NIP45206.1 methyltransferase domain-containing protein [Gammaproteobacteria bacterium]